jgi:lysophospholipase L1-like esterase
MVGILAVYKQLSVAGQTMNNHIALRIGSVIMCFATAILTISEPINAQTTRIVTDDIRDLEPLVIRANGRVEVRQLSSSHSKTSESHIRKSYIHQWPAVYFETAFIGNAVFLAFDDPYNEYRLIVDEGNPITLKQPGKNIFEIAGLSRKQHIARLEKVTESIGEVGAFNGFYIKQGKIGQGRVAKLPLPRRRQIEFIGDSGMTGYGIRSSTRTCTQEEVRLRSDSQIAYPAQVAKHFDADYQVNAISGRGMVRNYNGIVPDYTVPLIYPFILLDKTSSGVNSKWQLIYPPKLLDTTALAIASKWKPQIIVIALGNNDFSTPLKADEKWKNQDELIADYFASYDRFLAGLYQQNREANLIILWPDDNFKDAPSKEAFKAGKTKVIGAAQKLGFNAAEFNLYQDIVLDDSACDYHSSVMDHQKITARVISYLKSNPTLWEN